MTDTRKRPLLIELDMQLAKMNDLKDSKKFTSERANRVMDKTIAKLKQQIKDY